MVLGFGNGNGANGFENKIISLITSDYSWEQVIYDVIAAEGLDPWDLDLNKLSESFTKYLGKVKELDFRLPAKYVIIASMVLRMKSDHLRLLDIPTDEIGQEFSGDVDFDEVSGGLQANGANGTGLQIAGIPIPSKRRPIRKVTVEDLISSLKKAMATEVRREIRMSEIREKVKISTENITQKINALYDKINSILGETRKEEIEFSKLANIKDRKSVIDHFLPLMHLDHQQKVDCRQENMFDEIFIKKTNGVKAS